MHECMLSHFSNVQLFVTLWTIACQVLLSMARKLEWVAMPSSRGSSQPRDQTCVPYVFCIGRRVLYHQHHLGSPESLVGPIRNDSSFPAPSFWDTRYHSAGLRLTAALKQ